MKKGSSPSLMSWKVTLRNFVPSPPKILKNTGNLRLGLPADENDLFEKLNKNGIVSSSVTRLLRQMRGFRNILVHEYASVDDELVFKYAKTRLGDFEKIRKQILDFLRRPGNKRGK